MGLDGSIAGLVHGGHAGAVELARVPLDVALQGHRPHTWLEVEQSLQIKRAPRSASNLTASTLRRSAGQVFSKAPSLDKTRPKLWEAHQLVDAQPVCKVSSICQSCGKAQEADGQVCLCTDVAHAGHDHLQNGPPATATAPMTVNQVSQPTPQGFVSDSSSPMLFVLSCAS